MSILLSAGLSDTSRELGETSANQTSPRISHYNDAVIEFALVKKWSFLVKKDVTLLTVANTTTYSIPATILADWRTPGALKEISIGSTVFKPMNWEDRFLDEYNGKNFFYINPEETKITFMVDLGTAGQAVNVYYWYIPTRTSDLSTGSFPIPDQFRKTIALLSAAFVQWGRYLEGQGNRLFNLYERQLKRMGYQQSETHSNLPRKLQHFLAYRKFRRSYP